MVAAGERRASGKSGATEEAEKEAEGITQPQIEELPDERELWFGTLGMSRLRIEWRGRDRDTIQRAKMAVDHRMDELFGDVYSIMFDLYDIVREPELLADGRVKTDDHGWPVWQRTNTGGYAEDWSRLTSKLREDFLFRITTALFEWEQRAADLWGEAIFSKAVWTEQFADAYDSIMSGTVEDRVQSANKKAAEDRYFAVFNSILSRKADALIGSMKALMLRLRDTLDQ